MMNQNQELIKQAKAVGSPEELLALAKENRWPDVPCAMREIPFGSLYHHR